MFEMVKLKVHKDDKITIYCLLWITLLYYIYIQLGIFVKMKSAYRKFLYYRCK